MNTQFIDKKKTQLDILLNFLLDILANALTGTDKNSVIIESQYQVQNMAYIRILGARFSTR